MRRALSFLVLLAACGKDAPPLHVVDVSPKGEVTGAVPPIQVVFDRPVVLAEQIGMDVPDPPLEIEPPITGKARWIDRQTLVFSPEGALVPSTRYAVAVRQGLRAHDGAVLRESDGVEFVFERLEVTRARVDTGWPQHQPVDPVILLFFNHDVRPAALAQVCRFIGPGGARVAARPAEDTAPERTTLARLRPLEPLAPSREYELRCPARLRPAAGNVGLNEAYGYRFRTHGPLRVVDVLPVGRDVVPDEAELVIELSTPVTLAEMKKHVRLSPADEQPWFTVDYRDPTLHRARINLEPHTDYTITIGGELRDKFGQALGKTHRHYFRAADAAPRLRVERGIYAVEAASGRYPVWTRNLDYFDVTCSSVPPAKLTEVLTGPMNYDAWWDASDDRFDPAKLGLRVVKQRFAPGAPRNEWHDAAVDLVEACGGRGSRGGVFLATFSSDQAEPLPEWQPARNVLANVTDIGLTAKVGNASSLIWAVRLSDGTPVAGARVRIHDLGGKVRFSGRTDRDGTVSAPGATELAEVKPQGEDDQEMWWGDRRARRVIVTAESDGDLAVLDTNWNNGIQVWNFGLPEDRGGGAERLRGFLQSDRGLYRPGDTVHLRGLVRTVDKAGRMRLPRRRNVEVRIQDARGAEVADLSLRVSRFGGFSHDLQLSEHAPLGDWLVVGTIGDQSFRENFAVEEYRAQTFEVKLKPAARHVLLGKRVRFEVDARYLYGKPLSGGTVTWNVRRRQYLPSFEGLDQYTFQDEAALEDLGWGWAAHGRRTFSWPVADGEAALDSRGRSKITFRDDHELPGGPLEYLIEVSVQDESAGQAVTQRELVTAHRSDLYLGIHPNEWVQAVDMPFAVQAVALDREGKRKATRAELVIIRRKYDCGYTALSGYHCERLDKEVERRPVEVPATGAAVERIVPTEPGSYFIRVEAPDGRGGKAVTSRMVWVIGKGEAFWSGDESARMSLVASRKSYAPGDTAKLVPQANLGGASALVTLERDGIVKKWITRLESSGEAIEVPITPEMAPNVFASVTLVRGRIGEGNPGAPAFKMGTVNLEVDASAKRLKVAVAPDRPSYEPGETVTATVTVNDHEGEPVVAELAVAAADEGVLQILGFKTPDPMASFYQPWGLGVESSTTWNRIAEWSDPRLPDEFEEVGDGGGERSGELRERFMATAFWNPAVVTGRDGKATVRFPAPDQLTAFRLMAVAADAGDRFGSGEQRFTVAKPLAAQPALPRFMSVGDHAEVGVVVHNHTTRGGSVRVTAKAEGLELQGGPVKVRVEPGRSVPVRFPALARTPGQAKVQFTARLGEYRDAVAVTLPVRRPVVRETFSVGEGSTPGQVDLAVHVPDGAIAGEGGLEVTLDTTGLAFLGEGFSYLVRYPYGCLEQTTSSVIPMVALGELVDAVELPGVSGRQAARYVEKGIAKMLRHQHVSGGFSLWPGASPRPDLTAYALWGLHLARRAGHEVSAAAFTRGVTALRRGIAAKDDGSDAGRSGATAFALYVLAELEQPDSGSATRLYEGRAALNHAARAWLARALWRDGRKDEARTLIEELRAEIGGGNGPALVPEPASEHGWWYWSSEVRTTAIALSAVLEVSPKSPLADRLAAGLLGARQPSGRWRNTQDNLYALVALGDRVRARERAGAARVEVMLGDRQLWSGRLRGTEAQRISVPMADLNGGALVLSAKGATLYYSARLRVAREVAREMTAGLAVSREWLDANTGEVVTKAKLGQVVKVRVTVEAGDRQGYVAVVDRLPAGLEPVLDRFLPEAARDSKPRWFWGGGPTYWDHRELRDDRVQMFTDLLASGTSTFEYLARATTPGVFTAPGLTAEAMYEPAMRARAGASTFTVVQ